MPALTRFLSPALAVLALAMVDRASAQTGSKDSPFLPPALTAASAAGPNESLEFAGVNEMGTKTFISVFDKVTKKGRWIAVGGAESGISVLAYDPRRDQVVVKVGETQKTLTLRKATGTLNAPTPVAGMPPAANFNTPPAVALNTSVTAPAGNVTIDPAKLTEVTPPEPAPAPKAEAPKTTVARQEEEARMLVSDLLEIGMAQRKAYEEAQKKAAAAQTEQASQPAPATNPPGT